LPVDCGDGMEKSANILTFSCLSREDQKKSQNSGAGNDYLLPARTRVTPRI